MADLLDVENVLVAIAANAIYPNGTSQPSVAGIDVKIFAGWPMAANLETDIKNNTANISIYPTNSVRNTSRFDRAWQQLSINAPTLTLTVNNNNQITVGGTVSIPQSCMIINNGVSYVYVVKANDTLNTIAANINALIPNATVSNAVITIAGSYRLVANVGTTGASVQELDREERVFKITVWAPDYSTRSLIASAIRIAYSSAVRIALPDGLYANIKYSGSHELDDIQKINIYRRDIMFSVEYATTVSETDYVITYPFDNLTLSQN